IVPGDSIWELDSISLAGLSAGFHQLHVRVKDSTGLWSFTQNKDIYIYDDSPPSVPDTKSPIVAAEYFFDSSDPGYGNAYPISVANADSISLVDSVSISNLSLGGHLISMRVRDSSGLWSFTRSDSFVICTTYPPEAGFSYTRQDSIVSFIVDSSFTQAHKWLFGDGDSSTNVNPVHIYEVGTYEVCHIASNGCEADTFCQELAITGIISVDASKGENTGNVTISINGADLDTLMQVFLIKQGDTLVGENYLFVNPQKGFVTFDLAGADTGFYDMDFIWEDGGSVLKENFFEVLEGSLLVGVGNPGGTIGINCQVPSLNSDHFLEWTLLAQPWTRPNWIVTVQINYQNTANIDIPIPRRIFLSEGGAPIGFTQAELSEGKTELLLEFRELNGPTDILRAGASGSIILYAKASAPLIYNIIE
ncbi:MAG: hypothetical protein AAF587_08795, partial [Bacteroidota bacterium]